MSEFVAAVGMELREGKRRVYGDFQVTGMRTNRDAQEKN